MGHPIFRKNTVRIYKTLILVLAASLQETFIVFSCDSAHTIDFHESLSASGMQNAKPVTYNEFLTY